MTDTTLRVLPLLPTTRMKMEISMMRMISIVKMTMTMMQSAPPRSHDG